jgi:hypothetical protein
MIEEKSSFDEVESYLNEPLLDSKEDALRYWSSRKSSFKKLSQMAKLLLSIPATSIEVERLASEEGNVVTVKRCGLNPETVNTLVVSEHYLKNYQNKLI